MRIKFFFVSLLMAVMGMTIASCSHDDEKDIPCDDCGKTRIQVVCEGADGVVSRGGSFVGGKVSGDGVYESDYGTVPVTATADAGYYVSYFRGGPEGEPNQVDYAGTGETTYSTKANTRLGNHMYHIGFKKKVVIYTNEIKGSKGGKAGSTFSGESGTQKEITATPDNSFKFVSWSCTGGASVDSKTSARTRATIGSSNGTITANFEAVAPIYNTAEISLSVPESCVDDEGNMMKPTGFTGSITVYINGKKVGSFRGPGENTSYYVFKYSGPEVVNEASFRLEGNVTLYGTLQDDPFLQKPKTKRSNWDFSIDGTLMSDFSSGSLIIDVY